MRSTLGSLSGISDINQRTAELHNTQAAVGLLEAWKLYVRDCESEVCKWLEHGAPAGLLQHPASAGVFPMSGEDESQSCSLDALGCCAESVTSYDIVEADEDAWVEVNRLANAGYLKRFASSDDVCVWLNDTPVLSKFGMICETKGRCHQEDHLLGRNTVRHLAVRTHTRTSNYAQRSGCSA